MVDLLAIFGMDNTCYVIFEFRGFVVFLFLSENIGHKYFLVHMFLYCIVGDVMYLLLIIYFTSL